jgi:tRNA(fMet)-specific endonuclease VapC
VGYLIDSNVLIELMRSKQHHLVERFRAVLDECFMSTISLAELEYGVRKSRDVAGNQEKLERILRVFPVIEFSTADALSSGQVRAELEQRGVRIGEHDTLIAGQARARKLTVVTGNTREFERVSGLRVENWLTTSPGA